MLPGSKPSHEYEGLNIDTSYTAVTLFTFHKTATHWSQYLNVIPIYQYTFNWKRTKYRRNILMQNVQKYLQTIIVKYKQWTYKIGTDFKITLTDYKNISCIASIMITGCLSLMRFMFVSKKMSQQTCDATKLNPTSSVGR